MRPLGVTRVSVRPPGRDRQQLGFGRTVGYLGALWALPALASALSAQTPIRAADAVRHLGRRVTVEDIVAQVRDSRSGDTTFLNFGAPYPRQALSALVLARNRELFPGLPQWRNKRVRVTGTVVAGETGKPIIVCETPGQLRLLQSATQPVAAPTPRRSCCKICRKGKACGNSCIARNKRCHKPPGCACNGP
jgi:hypothetical protein